MFYDRIKNPWIRGAVDWLFSLGIALILFFVVREFIFRTARVDGNSMTPTLEHGDMVILNRFAYVTGTPRVGDIVAFPYAQNPSEHYIKRIIAAPGDVVDLREGQFWINGEPLGDDFSDERILSDSGVNFTEFPIEIEDEHFFVLGDNRNGSQDSRFSKVGNVPAKDMIGRAGLRIWPVGRLGLVK